jgi:2-polyprenyl-3-methyl-5-hydroxy-6-metoxy-1,4-benzoquinol methylase
MDDVTGHYNQDYFSWQKEIGEFGGQANLFYFRDFISPSDNVIDFGCGGGYLLANLHCREKFGVEINENVMETAQRNGIKVVRSTDEIQDEWADVIISSQVLEHTVNPYEELRRLYSKLKKGGRIIFVIPHEIRNKYRPKDRNRHLYSWSPMCAGNLFTAAGYNVEKVETIKYRWPPGYFRIRKYMGSLVFDLLCGVYARVRGDWYNVRVVARKP